MLDEETCDYDMLNKFFDTIKKHYNYGHDIDPVMKVNIEKCIEYRWIHDRN